MKSTQFRVDLLLGNKESICSHGDFMIRAQQRSVRKVLKIVIKQKESTQCGDRTHDHTIKSRALYRLS